MPCWEVRTVSLEMKIVDKKYLESAVKSLKWQMRGNTIITDQGERITIRDGRVESTNMNEAELTQVRSALQRQTSIEIIKAAAVRNKWGAVQVSPTKITLRRA